MATTISSIEVGTPYLNGSGICDVLASRDSTTAIISIIFIVVAAADQGIPQTERAFQGSRLDASPSWSSFFLRGGKKKFQNIARLPHFDLLRPLKSFAVR
ncbi:hypothetical protein Ancab_019065 [Ancistrocladus abbreviatus]